MSESTAEARSFAVRDCALAAIATGKRAHDLRELRDRLTEVPPESIYHHFWGALLRPRFENPEYLNDFAEWIHRELHDKLLAERLGVIDPAEFNDLEELRAEMVEIVEEHIDSGRAAPWSSPERPFQFIRSQIVVFDTHMRADEPRALAGLMPRLSVSAVFYHFIDARRRTPDAADDFRTWLGLFGPGHRELIDGLAAIDPYFTTLKDLRSELVTVFRTHFGGGR